jgi:branched-chain amino acid transport system ATP-binding protein
VPALLELDGVTAGYGKVEILHDLSISVPPGSVVALLGANGAGKTTTMRVISGTLPIRGGDVLLQGQRLNGRSAYEIARAGVVLIPEGRGIFPGLTVRENLGVASRAARGLNRQQRLGRVESVLQSFPALERRIDQRAVSMSGGEQQMLALSRALLAEPRLLLMDEISMGLAPMIVDQLFDTVAELKAQGMTIVLVEQYLTHALRLADICYVLAKGHVAFVGEPSELAGSSTLTEAYLGS